MKIHSHHRIQAILTIVVMLFTLMPAASTAASHNEICVYLNNAQVSFDVQPEINNNRTMVPMRAIFQQYGMEVEWTQSDKSIFAYDDENWVWMQIDNPDLYLNGHCVYTMDATPYISSGRTMVPLRAISEALNMNVTWDDATRSVHIDNKKEDEIPDAPDGSAVIDDDTTNDIDAEDTDINDTYIEDTTAGDTHFEVSDIARQMLPIINQYRAENGLAPLALDSKLCKVATVKAQDMADNKYFAHESPTYGSPSDLMNSLGVDWYFRGENIACGQTSVISVMNDWMNSPGHRANILEKNFGHIGIACVSNSNGIRYWVQEFTN